MTAGTVVITGGILATVILLCIIAVLCYCRLQYYCCKKDEPEEEEEEEEEEEPDLPTGSHFVTCNACNSRIMDGQGSPVPPPPELNQQGAHNYCPTCSPYGSPFYIRTADMVRNGGERITYTPTCYKEMGHPIKMATLQSYPVTRHGIFRETFPNPRAVSTEV
ncbi:PREDICTED: protein FAM163A [Crocodylus porosus]|uniref:Family with sequence similarity 163 member A n=1 Tax=Crocodylus porosus TaxID=8502 RepID=A0A7M4EGX8_CROPO|nr:PREDICTED: protein FAM163A [Crocodylus porosus]XP_019386477.1 PREDICTED: protein FAM163A [Crocodylus porosus]XP_019386478.1 PREDICTED: protein FAM163A [Crocodylus porosus]